MFAHIEAYFSRYKHIQDPGIIDSNNIKEHLLFKLGFSFKPNLFKSTWNIFLFLLQR